MELYCIAKKAVELFVLNAQIVGEIYKGKPWRQKDSEMAHSRWLGYVDCLCLLGIAHTNVGTYFELSLTDLWDWMRVYHGRIPDYCCTDNKHRRTWIETATHKLMEFWNDN